MFSSETIWASVATGAGAFLIKYLDKWFHRSEQLITTSEKESTRLEKDRVAELKRLYSKVEELSGMLERCREAHFIDREAILRKDMEMRRLKEDLADAEKGWADCVKEHRP